MYSDNQTLSSYDLFRIYLFIYLFRIYFFSLQKIWTKIKNLSPLMGYKSRNHQNPDVGSGLDLLHFLQLHLEKGNRNPLLHNLAVY